MKYKWIGMFVSTIMVLVSCSAESAEGKKIADAFLETLKLKQYEKALSYYSDGYLMKMEAQLQSQLEMFLQQEKRYGNILSYKIRRFKTRELSERKEIVYFVIHRVVCEKATIEIITTFCKKTETGKIELIEYYCRQRK